MVPHSHISRHCLQTWRAHHAQLGKLVQMVSIQTLGTKPAETLPTIGALFAEIHLQRLPWIQVVFPSRFHTLAKIPRQQALNPFVLTEHLDQSAEMIGDIFVEFAETDKVKGIQLPPITFLSALISREGMQRGYILAALALMGQSLSDEALNEISRWPLPKR